ncbi:polyprenyl synthetase family protein [Pelotomaculum terephthalicicum JT]|uniref:polyprenyl synthetase family protein n=1 Tax=Pelotomaculum TaxID=191373 RepID=UPI0009D02CE3|nr:MULTISPECIES: farnesyl diphosphate synthase [Pelotomaculum]MCG9968527.1 polyprenyl synthetase family protein [Pelotomaculum terephthalicicum JT]OPX85032.1 MAG: Farnesyl diphosphate synthase [Pelotomaculum sp. PtaB.Bin117]OPY62768.1 MAG: Farnesyl diphosphate synthase [Pelotomaculum sp. PtaU1.Bin065]
MNFEETLEKYSSIVEEALEHHLPPSNAYPPLIHQAMRYSVMGGGKRLRPVMVIAVAEAVGGKAADVMPAACALEMIHAYSLIHDDLPAMDNDDYRRGKPANHKVYGDAVAILAGDALLTLAFSMLANVRAQNTDDVVKVIDEIALAAGTFGMIGGQVVDTFSAGEDINERTLEYIHSHKTGALYRAAVRAGAILAGAEEEKLNSLTCYADNLGLAFQIIDDILDVEGDAAKIGKPVGSDVKNKKVTYPSLFGMEEARAKARQAAGRALSALDCFGEEADFLKMLVHYIIDRDY